MSPEKILFIDTETGGLEPTKHSLLSIAFVIWQDCRIVDKREILINDGVLNVTEKALEINKINLDFHKQVSLIPIKAILEIEKFLDVHFLQTEKITLGGHNINFDVNFLKHFLAVNGFNFYSRFSYRFIDTATILHFLFLSGVLDTKATSSQEAFELFKIPVDGRHTALGDAIATGNLFTMLLEITNRKLIHQTFNNVL